MAYLQLEAQVWIFPLTDSLKAPPSIIGESLVQVLLCDLHERNDCIPNHPPLGTPLSQLPMSQLQLQQAHLLSPLVLLHSPRVNRLHNTVPFKVAPLQAATKIRPPTLQNSNTNQQEEHETTETEQAEEVEDQLIQMVVTETVPANVQGRWTGAEIAMLMVHPNSNHAEAYNTYLSTCREMSLTVRTFHAFKKKRQRQQ